MRYMASNRQFGDSHQADGRLHPESAANRDARDANNISGQLQGVGDGVGDSPLQPVVRLQFWSDP
jgi:hypothetical protein